MCMWKRSWFSPRWRKRAHVNVYGGDVRDLSRQGRKGEQTSGSRWQVAVVCKGVGMAPSEKGGLSCIEAKACGSRQRFLWRAGDAHTVGEAWVVPSESGGGGLVLLEC